MWKAAKPPGELSLRPSAFWDCLNFHDSWSTVYPNTLQVQYQGYNGTLATVLQFGEPEGARGGNML